MKQPGSLIWLLRELIQKASPSSFLLLIRLFSAYLNHKILHMVSAHFRTPFTSLGFAHHTVAQFISKEEIWLVLIILRISQASLTRCLTTLKQERSFQPQFGSVPN